MKKNKISTIQTMLFVVVLCLTVAVNSYSAQYKALDGVKDVKVVFDVRAKKATKLAIQLELIHETYKDANIRAVTDKPQFVVVFGGSVVRFLSTDHEDFSEEEKIVVRQIAGILAALAKDGIRLEICMFAANLLDVEPDTVLPGIHHVDNGWISLIGYQAKGYSLVAAF